MRRPPGCVFVLLFRVLAIGSLTLDAAEANDLVFPVEQFGQNVLTLPQASAVVLEAQIAENPNFEPVSGYSAEDSIRVLSRPVGRLDIRRERALITCTASLVSDDKILTNYHCVPGADEDRRKYGTITAAALLLGFITPDAATERFEVDTTPLAQSPAPIDFALLHVNGEPGSHWGVVALASSAPAVGESLTVFHYPLGQPMQVTRARCMVQRIPAPDRMRHTCDTEPGSSGAPIFFGDHVIGLHHSGSPQVANFATPLSYLLVHVAQLASVVHQRTLPDARPATQTVFEVPDQVVPREQPTTALPAPGPVPSGIEIESQLEDGVELTKLISLKMVAKRSLPLPTQSRQVLCMERGKLFFADYTCGEPTNQPLGWVPRRVANLHVWVANEEGRRIERRERIGAGFQCVFRPHEETNRLFQGNRTNANLRASCRSEQKEFAELNVGWLYESPTVGDLREVMGTWFEFVLPSETLHMATDVVSGDAVLDFVRPD